MKELQDMKQTIERIEEIIIPFLCKHYACSDSEDNQYPKCEIRKNERQLLLKCPQKHIGYYIATELNRVLTGVANP